MSSMLRTNMMGVRVHPTKDAPGLQAGRSASYRSTLRPLMCHKCHTPSPCHSPLSSADKRQVPRLPSGPVHIQESPIRSTECEPTSPWTAGNKAALLASFSALLVGPGAAFAASGQKAAETLAESMASEGITPIDPANYVPSPVEVGWEIWFGAFAGAFPFAIGLYEFTKRIMIQRRCEACSGTGLVVMGERQLEIKCPQCGGFFPWRSWPEFLSATARPGNGGVLRFPKGQTSVFYTVPEKRSQDKTPASAAPGATGSEETPATEQSNNKSE